MSPVVYCVETHLFLEDAHIQEPAVAYYMLTSETISLLDIDASFNPCDVLVYGE